MALPLGCDGLSRALIQQAGGPVRRHDHQRQGHDHGEEHQKEGNANYGIGGQEFQHVTP